MRGVRDKNESAAVHFTIHVANIKHSSLSRCLYYTGLPVGMNKAQITRSLLLPIRSAPRNAKKQNIPGLPGAKRLTVGLPRMIRSHFHGIRYTRTYTHTKEAHVPYSYDKYVLDGTPLA